jgi:serine acetyltransferase
MISKQSLDKPYDLSFTSIIRGLLLLFLPIIAYFLGLFPIIIGFNYVYTKMTLLFHGLFFFILLTILLIFCFLLLVIFESFIPILIIRVFRIRTKPGEHDITIKNKEFFHHMLFFALYRPSLQLISFLPLVPLRSKLVKLAGLTIGKTSLLSGSELIDEPYGLTIGEHSLIGGFTTIYAHISDTTLRLKQVTIGNNCFIGNKSIILPGVTIEDNVYVEPGTVIAEDQRLKKGKRYAGNPATIVKP